MMSDEAITIDGMGWANRAWGTLSAAIGWRWGLVIAAGITLPGYVHRWAERRYVTALPDVGWTLFGFVAALFVVVWRVLHYATDLRLAAERKERSLLERQIEAQEAN